MPVACRRDFGTHCVSQIKRFALLMLDDQIYCWNAPVNTIEKKIQNAV